MTYFQKNPLLYKEKPADSVKMNEEFQQVYGILNEMKTEQDSHDIHDATEATTVADNDEFGFVYAVTSVLKKIKWSNIKAVLKTYFDTLYSVLGHTHPGTDVTSAVANATTAASCSGNAATATKLATARTISLTGDVTGSASFDGSGNAAITATVADDSHNHTIANVDSLQTTLDGKAASSHTHDYLPLSGGTITGNVLMPNGLFASYIQAADANSVIEPWVLGCNGSNFPSTGFFYMNTILYANSNQRHQIAYGYTNNDIYSRYLYGGSWSSWSKVSFDGHTHDYLATTGKAADSDKLDGYNSAAAGTASTVPVRDSRGDITTRLFRSTYANQATISGALAFRTNTTDNFIRFCSDMAAVRTFIGCAATSHTHSYVPTPTSSSLPVGMIAFLANTNGGNIANGGTVSGASLRVVKVATTSSSFMYGGTLSGTWKNITGVTIENIMAGLFVRTA